MAEPQSPVNSPSQGTTPAQPSTKGSPGLSRGLSMLKYVGQKTGKGAVGSIVGSGAKIQAAGSAITGAAWGLGAAAGQQGVEALRVAMPAGFWILFSLLVYAVDWLFGFNGIDGLELFRFLSLGGFEGIRSLL